MLSCLDYLFKQWVLLVFRNSDWLDSRLSLQKAQNSTKREGVMDKKWYDIENKLFQALNAPRRIRLWLIKKLFPEIIVVANTLRGFYWNE